VEQLLVVLGELSGPRHRVHQRGGDGGVEHRPTRRHLPDGPGQLVAFGDSVLEEVGVARRALGEEGDGVLGVFVLGEDDDTGAGVALAELLGRVDPLSLERRWHADVG
jgi:hypothetical protein